MHSHSTSVYPSVTRWGQTWRRSISDGSRVSRRVEYVARKNACGECICWDALSEVCETTEKHPLPISRTVTAKKARACTDIHMPLKVGTEKTPNARACV
jgi:hypothetical protein